MELAMGMIHDWRFAAGVIVGALLVISVSFAWFSVFDRIDRRRNKRWWKRS